MSSFLKEACVENLTQAINAEKRGADRIELCENLLLDGITPSEQLITSVKQQLNIPVRVMIRPRSGNFIYSKNELAKMAVSIEFCKEVGVEGVVFGILDTDNLLNLKETFNLVRIASPLKVTFHKAIDKTPNPVEALKKLVEMEGVNTVLTSGGQKTAFEGREILKEMIKFSEHQLEIMPAGRVTDKNIQKLHDYLGAEAYHGTGIVGDLMQGRKNTSRDLGKDKVIR